MSLSPREHEILGRIASELTRSDPKLASLAAGFNRLAASEAMPSRRPVSGVRRARQRVRNGRGARHDVRASWFFTGVWFVTSLCMIAVALVLNFVTPGTGGSRGCAQPWVMSCAGPRPGTAPGRPGGGASGS